MKTLQQLQAEFDAIKEDVEMTEAGIDPELIEESQISYLKSQINAANGYLSELWNIERKTKITIHF